MSKKATLERCPVCDRLVAYRFGKFYRHHVERDYRVDIGPKLCNGSSQSIRVLKEMAVRNV